MDWLWLTTLQGWFTGQRVENLLIAFGATIAGAIAGAMAAERIAAAKVRRSELLQEIKNTNAAIHLAMNVANQFLLVKGDYVKPLVDRFRVQQRAAHEFQRARDLGQVLEGVGIDLGLVDLSTLTVPEVRVHKLEAIVLEKLTAGAKIQLRTLALTQHLEIVRRLMSDRDSVIEEMREMPEAQRPAHLLGLRMANGQVDMRFNHLTEDLATEVDNCIHFSLRLCGELMEHGAKRLRTASRRERKKAATPRDALHRSEDARGPVGSPSPAGSAGRPCLPCASAGLDAFWKLGGHHFPAVELSAINYEGPVANRVQRPSLLARRVLVGRHCRQHHDVVLFD